MAQRVGAGGFEVEDQVLERTPVLVEVEGRLREVVAQRARRRAPVPRIPFRGSLLRNTRRAGRHYPAGRCRRGNVSQAA